MNNQATIVPNNRPAVKGGAKATGGAKKTLEEASRYLELMGSLIAARKVLMPLKDSGREVDDLIKLSGTLIRDGEPLAKSVLEAMKKWNNLTSSAQNHTKRKVLSELNMQMGLSAAHGFDMIQGLLHMNTVMESANITTPTTGSDESTNLIDDINSVSHEGEAEVAVTD